MVVPDPMPVVRWAELGTAASTESLKKIVLVWTSFTFKPNGGKVPSVGRKSTSLLGRFRVKEPRKEFS